MLKKLLSAVTGAVMMISIPVAALAAERYEILQVGDEDPWVMELQERLHEEGYLSVDATGYYGTNTQNAVIKYQKDHGLSVDGKAGPATRKSILGDDYREITEPRPQGKDTLTSAKPDGSASAEATPKPTKAPETDETDASVEPEASSTPKPSEDASSSSGDTLQLGDKGEAISELQETLREYEYYDYDSITGYYGPVTKDAVVRFQRQYGLKEDGIVGPEAQAILKSGSMNFYTMHEGDKGDDVQKLQKRLKELGYLTGSATGYYGDVTKKAVENFQTENGLAVDGNAGKETRSAVYGDSAVASSGETQSTEDGEAAVTALNSSAEPSALASASSDSADKPKDEGADQPSSKLDKFLSVAEGRIGKSYVYGAVGPNSFDCSGFVYYCLKGAGVGVSRLSSAGYASYSSWQTIKSKNDLKIGDLVFFRSDSSSSISHVGIYLGGGNFIHAAPSLKGVGYSTMSSGYYSRNFVSGKRVF